MANDLPRYRAFLLRSPCCCDPCVAAVEVHHAQHGETHIPGAAPPKALGGKRGKSQRASDWWGLSLCPRHHRQLHDLSGYFVGWSGADLRVWQDKHIARLRNAFTMTEPQPIAADPTLKPGRPGAGWTAAGILSLLKQEARHRPAEVSAAFKEIVGLIERKVL